MELVDVDELKEKRYTQQGHKVHANGYFMVLGRRADSAGLYATNAEDEQIGK